MKQTISMALVVALVSASHAAAAMLQPPLLQQVQAADVLSDLLGWSVDRATVRCQSMQDYLKETGKLEAFTQVPAPTTGPAPHGIFYDQLFAGAVQFVQDGGAQYADPSLANLGEAQLKQELAALQNYNLQQFIYLNRRRAAIASMKAYLDSIKFLPAYTAWAGQKNPELAATPGQSAGATSVMSPEQRVAHSENLMKAARAAAEKRAEAAGMSPSDFDKQWDAKQNAMRLDIAKRLDGMSSLAAAFAKTPSAPASPANSVARTSPGPVVTPQTDAQAFWQFSFGDPFTTTYQGPGEYGAYDTRVNIENDQRVNGEYDRRANLNYDRRTNIQLTPRKGV
jgi:hypothetical protein